MRKNCNGWDLPSGEFSGGKCPRANCPRTVIRGKCPVSGLVIIYFDKNVKNILNTQVNFSLNEGTYVGNMESHRILFGIHRRSVSGKHLDKYTVLYLGDKLSLLIHFYHTHKLTKRKIQTHVQLFCEFR